MNVQNIIKQYITLVKLANRKVTEDSISTYFKNKGAHNIGNKSIIKILKQLQG